MIARDTPIGTMVVIAHKPENTHDGPGWEPEMDMLLGKVGKITYKSGTTMRVSVENHMSWAYLDDWLDLAVVENGHVQGNCNIHIDQELPP